MKHINLFEKFKQEEYNELKKEREEELIQKIREEFVVDIVKEGDFEGMEFLLSTGFDLKYCDSDENLFTVAVMNEQIPMLEYLLKSPYGNDEEDDDNGGWGDKSPINSVILSEITGRNNNGAQQWEKPEDIVKCLKILYNYGYEFTTQLFRLYLTDRLNSGYIIEGIDDFIDFFLEKEPEMYPEIKEYLPPDLQNHFKYLERSGKVGLWDAKIKK